MWQHDRGEAGWLVGDGDVVELIRAKDWGQTPLGPIAQWPESLRTTVSLVLASSFPINLIWGEDCVQIWNEGYAVICGDKHPSEFGSDYRKCWASAWPAIGGAFAAARSGQTAYLENQSMFLDRNGYLEETSFTFSLSPIRGEGGEIAGLFHPVTETTSRTLAERRTRALRDLANHAGQARSVQEAAQRTVDILADHDADLPFVLVYLLEDHGRRARLAASTGIPAGHPAVPATVQLDGDGAAGPVAQAIARRETVHVRDVAARRGPIHAGPSGDSVDEVLVLPIVLPGDEQPIGTLTLAISPRLALDEAYRSHFELVTAGVTSAIGTAVAYARERARAEALAELDRAKTTFFTNVSHELRTPLTLILGPLEDELRDAATRPDAERTERLEIAHRNALRLLRLVNSLLDFTRIEAGRTQATFRPTDLAAATADLAGLFRSATERAQLRLEVDCPPLDEPVLVDADMWEKIVVNLLSNAFKHTFEGGITVRVRQVGRTAQLTVADTGVGIAAQELPLLFDRFHRVQDTRSRVFEGTGIGLALVRELARIHGGDATVTSDPGTGSTFTVSIPLGRAHLAPEAIADTPLPALGDRADPVELGELHSWIAADDADPATPARDVPAAGPAAGVEPATPVDGRPRPRILLADDNADMRSHVARLLRPSFEVTAVRDGRAALERALLDPHDLVLTDVMMPRLDGFGLLDALRSDPRTRTIPVIMLSARAGEEAAVEGLWAGADDYLAKPFSARELLARVNAALSLAALRRESAEQLAAANEVLQAAARAKSEFLANMSHEIRTPMNAIIGMTSLLLDSPLDEAQRESAGIIRTSGEHLLTVISDVLDFSRIEAGRIDLEVGPFDLRDCAESVMDIATAAAAGKQLRLRHTIAADVPATVHGDAGRLRQVLINLLGNAVKFTDRGEVHLTVRRAGPAADGTPRLSFAVSDTGAGIAEVDQAMLFDAFTQVDATTTRAHEGTGLGLAISRHLADLLGGSIALQSVLGEGSTFVLTVPLRSVDAPAGDVAPPAPAPTTGAALPPAEGTASRLPPMRVLIVEDHRVNQRVAVRLLERLGQSPDVAADGAEALEAVTRQTYDLVLMDIQMPHMDGLEATRRIRALGHAGPHIVGLSAHASAEVEEACLAAGMNAYMSKPIRAQWLTTLLTGLDRERGSVHET